MRLTRLVDRSFLPAVLAADRPIVATGATEGLCGIFEEGEVTDLVRRLAPEHVAVVSLRGRDRVVGLLTVLRDSARGGFSGEDLDTLAQVAGRAGLAVDNARLFAEQRDLAEGLQRSLLTAPPQPDHLEIVVRYEAAAETAQVGGDWYDAFVQDAGATMLVIGDVVGHDTAAAAAMGQVRNLLRGISAFSGPGPGDVLRGVDRALDTLGVDTTATAVLARLEQTPEEVEEGVTRLRWSNAGHPPPAVLAPDGTVDLLLTDDPDLLLGLDPDVRRGEQQVVLRRGSTVLLFTDGLVERRGEDLDVGLERLRRELASLAVGDPPLDELCDRLLARMVPSVREDDIALVAVRLHEQDGPPPSRRVQPGPGVEAVEAERTPTVSGRIVRTRFPADPASVPGARRFVREALRGRGAELVDDAELCVGELAANAALHSGGAMMDVSVRLDHGATTVAVADEGDVPAEALVPRLVVEPDDASLRAHDRAWAGHRLRPRRRLGRGAGPRRHEGLGAARRRARRQRRTPARLAARPRAGAAGRRGRRVRAGAPAGLPRGAVAAPGRPHRRAGQGPAAAVRDPRARPRPGLDERGAPPPRRLRAPSVGPSVARSRTPGRRVWPRWTSSCDLPPSVAVDAARLHWLLTVSDAGPRRGAAADGARRAGGRCGCGRG